MKCRRRHFRNHMRPSVEHYWDRARQCLVVVPAQKRSEAGMSRRMRRHGYSNVQRARNSRMKQDNYVDKLVSMERDHQGQVERVGDKFRILDEQEA